MATATTISEEQLIELLRSKTRGAFDYLYDNYSSALYGIIFNVVKDEELANDVLQETFTKIWRSFEQYDSSKGRLFTWMLNIARNLSIDKVRSKDFRNQQKNRNIENNVSVVDGAMSTSLEVETIGLRKLVERLNAEQQVIMNLLYFQGYTQQEVSEELGIPLGTVKTRARSAIIELRKNFDLT